MLNKSVSPFLPAAALLLSVSSGAWAATTYPQQTINGFSPSSGPAGTVVTVTGSGFTGSNAAWVGNGHDATVTVVSDSKLTVMVPADATTGAIGILNPSHAAFSPSAFTLTATTTYPQQSISGFSPTSGSAGTTVTVNGKGFTGSNAAWVGNGHDAALKVISDTQASVTVPADGTTGAIAILNPSHSASTSTSFTVSSSTSTTYPQPMISGFSPTSGPAGTVVTISGSGFTGINAAWVGNGHDAKVAVLSDSTVTVTVPADATTGAIGILNPKLAAFTPTAFTLASSTATTSSSSSSSSSSGGTTSSSSSGGTTSSSSSSSGGTTSTSSSSSGGTTSSSSSGGSSTLSIRVQGNHFVNGGGQTVQLRGVNYSGFEFVAIQGWSPSDPSGAQAGQPNGPNWAAINTWRANVVRIPLNEASWLGYTCTDTSGVVHNPDPGSNYKSAVATQVAQANAAGLYVILDLHWTAPGTTCPMLQSQMADADHSLDFWTSVANQFKGNPAVLFELFNEPYLNFDFSGDSWSYMMKGTNGAFSGFPATSNTGNWKNVTQAWAIASYQQMLNAVRATGATNVVLVGTMQYSQDLSNWLAYRPTDPLSQMAAAWHPYPTYGTTWGTAAYAQPNFSPQIWTEVQGILAAGIPVIATETGDQNSPGTVGAPLVSNVVSFADQNGVSVVGWAWDTWGDANNVLIKDVNGTPTDGYGQTFRSWLVNHQ